MLSIMTIVCISVLKKLIIYDTSSADVFGEFGFVAPVAADLSLPRRVRHVMEGGAPRQRRLRATDLWRCSIPG